MSPDRGQGQTRADGQDRVRGRDRAAAQDRAMGQDRVPANRARMSRGRGFIQQLVLLVLAKSEFDRARRRPEVGDGEAALRRHLPAGGLLRWRHS